MGIGSWGLGKKGNWELGVRGWGRRGWGDGGMGRRRELGIGSWDLGKNKKRNYRLMLIDFPNSRKLALLPPLGTLHSFPHSALSTFYSALSFPPPSSPLSTQHSALSTQHSLEVKQKGGYENLPNHITELKSLKISV
uniref:Uncharacterized protein n=1 Tax=Desertifilum tharense IPPAS B-1220 TaxID=1781255 RepID=A0A1E5QM85_9CYAN|nr:hypothetical protein BH720_07585 [Desertifilum tharense IPPAS B-1220]